MLKGVLKRIWESPVILITGLFVFSICLFLFIRNFKEDDFLKVDLMGLLTIILGYLITFLLSAKSTRDMKRKECIEHVVDYIEGFVSDDNNFQKSEQTLFRQSNCANRIKYLKDAKFIETREDIDFIKKHFQRIRDLYSDHSTSPESLRAVKKDIDKHRQQIIDKCIKIRIELYK